MTIVYRHLKGAPLTIEEVDGNFADLDQRLRRLETEGVTAEGVGEIRQVGEMLEVIGTLGRPLGRFLLPKALPTPKGLWQERTDYLVLDWVHHEGNLYACVRAHNSKNFAADLASGCWQLLLRGAANGK